MNRRAGQYSVLLLIPLILFVFSMVLKASAGPYWLATNLDPAYQYFVNGVYLLKGLVPNHADHPGTPVQMLCAAVDYCSNLGRPLEDVVRTILSKPEFYMQMTSALICFFNFATAAILGIYIWRRTDDLISAVLVQLPALAFLTLKSGETDLPVLPVVVNLSPEPMVIGVINLFSLGLLAVFFSRNRKEECLAALGWGFVSGMGVAVKLTVLPIIAIPLLVLSWGNKLIFAAVCAASFCLWTIPIISKYPIIWGWISGVAAHKSAYGSGGGGVVHLLANVTAIAQEEWAFVALLAVAVILIVRQLMIRQANRGTFFLTAVVSGICFQFAAVTQHPGAHYLLPGLSLFGVLLVLIYGQGVKVSSWGKQAAVVFIVVGVIAGLTSTVIYNGRLSALTRGLLSFRSKIATEYPNCTVVDYYRSSDPAAALFFGDGWNLSPHLGRELAAIYPDKYYYHLWGNAIFDFNGRVWSNDLLSTNPCVLFRGDGKNDFSQGSYQLQLVDQGNVENAQLLTGTTEKQGAMLLAAGFHELQSGDYQQAHDYALKARQFHYQPDSSVENLLGMIKNYSGQK